MMKNIAFIVLFAAVLAAYPPAVTAQSVVVERMDQQQGETITGYPSLDKQLRFSIEGGYSHRMGKFVDEIPSEFVSKMRTGYNFGAELTYFPAEAWGIGMKFSGRMFTAEMGSVRDETNLYYVAPVAMSRIFDKRQRNAWVFGFSVGYLMFREKMTIAGESTKINKGGVGSSAEVGYDIRVSKRNFVGIKLSVTSGSVYIDVAGEKERENASSLDLSAGFRF